MLSIFFRHSALLKIIVVFTIAFINAGVTFFYLELPIFVVLQISILSILWIGLFFRLLEHAVRILEIYVYLSAIGVFTVLILINPLFIASIVLLASGIIVLQLLNFCIRIFNRVFHFSYYPYFKIKVSILWLFWLFILVTILFTLYNASILLYDEKSEKFDYAELSLLDPLYTNIQKKDLLYLKEMGTFEQLIHTSFTFPNRILLPQVVGKIKNQELIFFGGFSLFSFERDYATLREKTHHRLQILGHILLDISPLEYHQTKGGNQLISFNIRLQHWISNSVITFFCIQSSEDIHSALYSTWVFVKKPYHKKSVVLDLFNVVK